MKTEKIETKYTERRLKTTEPALMQNMFTASRVMKTWIDDFVDEDNGEVVSIERNEVILDRGVLIGPDNLSELQFHIQCGDVKEVEVSNQRRMAFPIERKTLRPYLAIAEVGEKKQKILFWSQSMEQAIPLLKDYIELNYNGGFLILSIKEFDTSIILLDTFKKLKPEADGERKIEEGENKLDDDNKKFYQIEFNVVDFDGTSRTYTAVVQTYNVDRAMMLINDWLNKNEYIRYEEAKAEGREYILRDLTTTIESAKPIPVGEYIPREFSQAYLDHSYEGMSDAVHNLFKTLDDNDITMTVSKK